MDPQLSDNIKKKWIGIKMAEKVSGLDKVNKSHAMARRLAKKQQDGTLMQDTVEPQDQEEDNVINVGDTYVTHQAPQAPPQPQVPPQQPIQPQPVKQELSGLQKGLAVAALVGGGMMAPTIGGMALDAIARRVQVPQAPQQQFKDTDTDTQYELGLSSGKTKGRNGMAED